MKVEVLITKHIEVQEGERILTLSFEDDACVGFDSNLPYQKSLEDWKFFHKALGKILKEMKI